MMNACVSSSSVSILVKQSWTLLSWAWYRWLAVGLASGLPSPWLICNAVGGNFDTVTLLQSTLHCKIPCGCHKHKLFYRLLQRLTHQLASVKHPALKDTWSNFNWESKVGGCQIAKRSDLATTSTLRFWQFLPHASRCLLCMIATSPRTPRRSNHFVPNSRAARINCKMQRSRQGDAFM